MGSCKHALQDGICQWEGIVFSSRTDGLALVVAFNAVMFMIAVASAIQSCTDLGWLLLSLACTDFDAAV